MYTLASVPQLRSRLDLDPETNAVAERLARALTAATARIERASGRHFLPLLATLPHRARHPRELALLDDLLQLQRLDDGAGQTIDPRHVETLPIAAQGSVSVLRLSGERRFVGPVVQVTGLWGWHDRRHEAWLTGVDQLQDDPLPATSATLRVRDGGRFQPGQLLRIAEEYLLLLEVNAPDRELRVQRGAQGTTAAAHHQGSAVDLYQPPAAVNLLCLRLAEWLYREPHRAPGDALPADLAGELRALRRDTARS